ncbi:uncharacterized protein [Apostichopus japonicus]
MEKGKHRTLTRILRVGKEILVLLELTILPNNHGEDCTRWFSDNELKDVLEMIREPILHRMEEHVKQELRIKKKMKKTNEESSRRLESGSVLTSAKIKVGLQLRRHSLSKICLIPSDGSNRVPNIGSFHNHSGGGFDDMLLFPEKAQVVVCENVPVNKDSILYNDTKSISTNSQPISKYFKSTSTSESCPRKTVSSDAKKKKLCLKKIVSQTNMKSASDGAGFVPGCPRSSDNYMFSNNGLSITCHKDLALQDHEEIQNMNLDIHHRLSVHSKENTAMSEMPEQSREKKDRVQMESNILDAERNSLYLTQNYTERDHEISGCRKKQSIEWNFGEKCIRSKTIDSSNCYDPDYYNGKDTCGVNCPVTEYAMGIQQSKLSSDILVECTAIKGQENCSEKAQEKEISFTKYPRYENNFIMGKKEKSFADILGDKYVGKTMNTNEKKQSLIFPSFKENRELEEDRSGDEMINCARKEVLMGRRRDSSIHDQSSLLKVENRKRKKLKRGLYQTINPSSSDEESCHVDISLLLQEKSFKRVCLKAEDKTDLEQSRERLQIIQPKHCTIETEAEHVGQSSNVRAKEIAPVISEKTGKAVLNCQSDHLLILSNATCDNKPKLHSERDHPWQGAIGNDECFQNMDALFCNETPVNSELKSQRNLDDEAMPGILKEGDGSLRFDQSGSSVSQESDDSLPEISYARVVEKKMDVFAGTAFEESTGDKELSNSYHKDLPTEENVNEHHIIRKLGLSLQKDVLNKETSKRKIKLTAVADGSDCLTSGDDNCLQNNVSAHAYSNLQTSGKRTFFPICSYEYIQSQNESFSLKHVIGEASKDRNIKKRPKSFQATNLQKKKSFGSLKQFDDNAYKRTKKVGGIHHKSQLEVTPETCSRWWINDAKKDVRSEVIDCDFSDDEMEESLKTIKNVSELSGDQLQYLTKVNASYLREIFQGRRACLRHTEYKSSSSLRAEMMYLVSYGDFSVDNLEIIMDTLVPIFCRKSSKFLDYVSKVLLPELLVKICMDVLHLDYKEAESLF